MTLRCFIAIELDPELKDALARKLRSLRKQLQGNEASLRWVEPDKVHLTLKFLGQVEQQGLDGIKAALARAAASMGAFSFTVADCGCFPPRGPARVLWLGITQGQDELAELARRVDRSLSKLGFAREQRPFSPHLTLARIKHPPAGRAVRHLVEKAPSFTIGAQQVTRLSLMQSQLTPQGSLYTPLHHVPLGSGGA